MVHFFLDKQYVIRNMNAKKCGHDHGRAPKNTLRFQISVCMIIMLVDYQEITTICPISLVHFCIKSLDKLRTRLV